MTLFARSFLLVFCQMGVGGLLALAVPPFHDLARGFYKSSASVFFSLALVGAGGTVYLALSRDESGVGALETVLWPLFLLLFAGYLSTLWGEAMRARARLYAASLAAGLLALGLAGASLAGRAGAGLGVAAALSSLASAAVLGGVTTGMLIGHWYLIDPGMDLGPFRSSFRFFERALLCQIAVLAVVLAAILASSAEALAGHLPLVALRIVLGPAAAFGIALLLRRVLAIPQTMAATGLFYIATLAAMVGELLGRYFTFRTGLPL